VGGFFELRHRRPNDPPQHNSHSAVGSGTENTKGSMKPVVLMAPFATSPRATYAPPAPSGRGFSEEIGSLF
jgi:hypothetical protein